MESNDPTCMANDPGSLIHRWIEATDDADGSQNSKDACRSILEEMRRFLRGNFECGKGCGFSGDYQTCFLHEEACTWEEHDDSDSDSDGDSDNHWEDGTSVRRHVYLSIGSKQEPLRLELLEGNGNSDNNDERGVVDIDLSSSLYNIGDEGCVALCNSLVHHHSTTDPVATTTTKYLDATAVWNNIRMLDLEANGLSSVSGSALATALSSSLSSSSLLLGGNQLVHLNLGCNHLGPEGVMALADALALVGTSCGCPRLESLDLHGNSMENQGCVALAAALCTGSVPLLQTLDLSANRIETRGCTALSEALFSQCIHTNRATTPLDHADGSTTTLSSCDDSSLFGCCPSLTHLNLRENGIESIAPFFETAMKTITTTTTTKMNTKLLPCLVSLDLSWNSITNFDALAKAFTTTVNHANHEPNGKDPNPNPDPNGGHSSSSHICPLLSELNLQGNSLSDRGCAQLCSFLKTSGAMPLLLVEEKHMMDGNHGEPDHINNSGAGVGEGRMRRCLQLLADGTATNSRVCDLALWETSTDSNDETNGERNINKEALFVMGNDAVDLLRRDGFVVVEPPIALPMHMVGLVGVMERVERNGWPPVFCFMNDMVWEFVTRHVWPIVSDLFGNDGNDCVLDPSSAFAWSLKANGKSTFPRNGEFRSWQNAVSGINSTVPKERAAETEHGYRGFGSSFGLPHRDFSASDSIVAAATAADKRDVGETVGRQDEEIDTNHDDPAILTVWIPLNDATLENGCMYVVPIEFDADFGRTDEHCHMNPATEVRRGVSSKIHFPLHGVRALPAPAGSLIAWYGNSIHWGSSCSRFQTSPRKSIALTFRRAERTKDCTMPSSSNSSSSISHDDEVPVVPAPITMAQACTLTPELRLALISRSLLLYNQWHALADDAVPPLIYETTAKYSNTRAT